MDEKTMVNDILNDINSELKLYQTMIIEAENLGLRQSLIQLRNNMESYQYELIKIAKLKGYYPSKNKATTKEIQNVKNMIQ